MTEKYFLVDSGDQQKLERFGSYLIARPCSQALWKPTLPKAEWDRADAHFSRDGGNSWNYKTKLPAHWISEVEGVRFKISPTDFGHLGVFPEHSLLWKAMKDAIRTRKEPPLIQEEHPLLRHLRVQKFAIWMRPEEWWHGRAKMQNSTSSSLRLSAGLSTTCPSF